jgi:predicted DsbA family dithiol-disulfide isomerase
VLGSNKPEDTELEGGDPPCWAHLFEDELGLSPTEDQFGSLRPPLTATEKESDQVGTGSPSRDGLKLADRREQNEATEPRGVELWQWAEYYCPWSYIATVRLTKVMPDLQGRTTLRLRPFPLELIDGYAAPRDILEQEWWLAAIQEPAAEFAPFRGDDWPTTTLPAFEAAWCAARQGDDALIAFDLRVRRAFFAEGRNIGRREVLREIAVETGLDLPRFERDFAGDAARAAVVAEARLGRERFHVPGTPTLMLADGTRLRHPIAYPDMQNRVVVSVPALPCCGDGCYAATRSLIEEALATQPALSG